LIPPNWEPDEETTTTTMILASSATNLWGFISTLSLHRRALPWRGIFEEKYGEL
jgi:hypothetical protein